MRDMDFIEDGFDYCDDCENDFDLEDLQQCEICFQEFCEECFDDHIC